MRWTVKRSRRAGDEFIGRIYVESGETLRCAVSNLSASGAALRTDAPLPPEFDLEIPKLKKIFRASLHWKDRHEAGVFFLQSPVAASPVAASADAAG